MTSYFLNFDEIAMASSWVTRLMHNHKALKFD